jgi:hypothetical protein
MKILEVSVVCLLSTLLFAVEKFSFVLQHQYIHRGEISSGGVKNSRVRGPYIVFLASEPLHHRSLGIRH